MIRQEVESLLAAHDGDSTFMNTPVGNLLVADQPMLSAGQHFGPYEEISLLGEGGMGQVYLAVDTRLGRKVALKLLPSSYMGDAERVRRFRQEARAASALNHPNIVTIHEIGKTDSLHFIATEFVDGETLRQHVMKMRMTLGAVLDVAGQIASALEAAHEAGIVHRDVKPENIMLRRDGFVKVLDFGLAKLAPYHNSVADSQAPTDPRVMTNPGVVMGTVGYMSPEQARGAEVDARTDLWSLGVVLYEMVAGRPPFQGETPSHVIVSILESEPPPLSLGVEVPRELERIITKALQKDRGDRYQTAGEMALDLKSLKEELTVESRLKQFRRSDTDGRETAGRHGGYVGPNTAPAAARSTKQITVADESALPVAELEEKPSDTLDRFPVRQSIWLAALVLIISGAGIFSYRLALRNQVARKDLAFQRTQVTRLTNTGNASVAAISPDGKYVAYAVKDKGRHSLWLRQVAAFNGVQIVEPVDGRYVGATFSNDGNYVYYVVKPKNITIGSLYRVPALGGNSTKLISDVDSPVSFSPDGQKLSFVRGSFKGEYALMVANADGTGEQTLAVRKSPDVYLFGGPAWSPDGSKILCAAGNHEGGSFYENVVEVQVASGAEKPVSDQKWQEIGRINWFADGSGFVMPASDRETDWVFQLWHVSYPDGNVRRITHDFSDYRDLNMTADGSALVAVHVESTANIWLMSLEGGQTSSTIARDKSVAEASEARQITFGVDRYDGASGMAWTPDGKIIFRSRASGRAQIWSMKADGSEQKQLTDPAHVFNPLHPFVTVDGRDVLFVSTIGFANVWRMDADGGNLKQLSNGRGEFCPTVSPDGKWLVYSSDASGKQMIWKMSLERVEPPVQLTHERANFPVISPDGKWVACNYRDEQGGAQWRIAIVPFEGGAPARIFEIPSASSLRPIQWLPDGSAITYISTRDEDSSIWSQPLDGSAPKKLTDFKTDKIFDFAWSPDGRRLALSRGAIGNDVVLIKNLGSVAIRKGNINRNDGYINLTAFPACCALGPKTRIVD
jgi:serine/threonine protein kinase/dipeptidyl aminopeptidase/acylaminoacyl peptidase